MVNAQPKLTLMRSHVNKSFSIRCASGVAGVVLWKVEVGGEAHGQETTAATAGTDADQGRRKRTARPVQQFDDDSPQRRGVHSEFHLHFSQRNAGQASQQRYREPGPCKTHLAGPGRKHFALRNTVWAYQRSARRCKSHTAGGVCSVTT